MPVEFKCFLHIAAVAAVTAASTYAVRYFVIEPRGMHEHCELQAGSTLCVFRRAVVVGFDWNVFSLASLALGVLALVLRVRSCAWAAVILGVVGALLYRIEFAGFGLLCGALALARPPFAPQDTPRYERT
jgi:hypothetical protein